ncbi:MAG: hypothetical protein R6U92_07355 [Bacillota bacterium]
MPEEIFAVVAREWRERIPAIGGGRLVGIVISALLVAGLGVLLPLRVGQRWMSLSVVGIVATCTVSVLSMDYVLATISGERILRRRGDSRFRGTSDESIVFGEIVAGSLYAFLMILVVLLAGLITVNLGFPAAEVRLYPAGDLVAILLASLLLAELFGGLASVVLLGVGKEGLARVLMISVILAVFILPPFLYAVGPEFLRASMSDLIFRLGRVRLLVTGMTFLLALDVAVLLWLRERVRNGGLGSP